MKFRIKVYSKCGVHRVTVVGDDGVEAELKGVTNFNIDVAPDKLATLSVDFIEFVDAIEGV